jgi:hypothetical protein
VPSVKVPGFCTAKKPAPLMAMKVATDAVCTSPCTELVLRDCVVTPPANCWVDAVCGIRSRKLVSTRLKAVVCEFAILPETFSSAYDCERRPPTAVVRAPKIPMTYSPNSIRAARRSHVIAGRVGRRCRKRRAKYKNPYMPMA